MRASRRVVPLAITGAMLLAGCGGSSSQTPSTAQSIDPQVFKQNAETYLGSVKGLGGQLASCVTQSLTSGVLGGSGQGQQSGPAIQTCIENFTSAVKRESDAAQSATLTYLNGVASPCKEKVQAFDDEIKAITELLTKNTGGNDNQAASKLIAAVESGEVQTKLAQAKATFTEMTKTCANLAPKGN